MRKARRLALLHKWLTIAWGVTLPVSVVTGWIYAVAFVSVCSIYANMVSHWSAYQAACADIAARSGRVR